MAAVSSKLSLRAYGYSAAASEDDRMTALMVAMCMHGEEEVINRLREICSSSKNPNIRADYEYMVGSSVPVMKAIIQSENESEDESYPLFVDPKSDNINDAAKSVLMKSIEIYNNILEDNMKKGMDYYMCREIMDRIDDLTDKLM